MKTFCKLSISLIGLFLFDSSALADTFFNAQLNGAQVVPATASTATGDASLQLNNLETELAYTIQLNGVDLDGAQTPGDADDDVIMVFIHFGWAGINGGAVFDILNQDIDDLVVDPVAGTLTGIWEQTDFGFQQLDTQIGNLLADNLYILVRTSGLPGGEIRGQIIRLKPVTIPTLDFVGGTIMAFILLVTGGFYIRHRNAQ